MRNNYNKKFSVAHWDKMQDDFLFLKCFENSDQQYKNEIFDIYFGSTFLHRDITYGDTMGVSASPTQYRNLLKIQEKYGIPISLTFNEMTRPLEMIRKDVMKEFVAYVGRFYRDGVRSCTISHVHLMKTGVLQSTFPDMNWKNTVNHRICSTQEFIDYVELGYNILQLDRNYNRNLNELKRTKKEADRLGVKTCLLIIENCMPECPFKVEHDVWQGGKILRDLDKSYWEVAGHLSCNEWRTATYSKVGGTLKEKEHGVANPRTGTDIMLNSRDDWDEFANNVDVFKISGRLNTAPAGQMEEKFGYFIEMWKDRDQQEKHPWPQTIQMGVSSFKEIYENNLAPFFMWLKSHRAKKDYSTITDIDKIKKTIANHFWNSEEAIDLCTTLKRCKNQCYNCHKCDDLFNTGKIDSILSLGQNKEIEKRNDLDLHGQYRNDY